MDYRIKEILSGLEGEERLLALHDEMEDKRLRERASDLALTYVGDKDWKGYIYFWHGMYFGMCRGVEYTERPSWIARLWWRILRRAKRCGF